MLFIFFFFCSFFFFFFFFFPPIILFFSKNLLTVLKIIYKYINDGLFDKVFDMYSLKEAGGRILEFDECIWNYIKSSKTDHYKCLDILNIIGGGSKEQHKKNEQHKKKMNNIKKNNKNITT